MRIEYLNFDMWSDTFNSQLAVALSANRAPSYYVARNLPQTIEQGMYADLTPLMAHWDEFKNQPNNAIHEGVVNGHIYTVASGELSALIIRYRKDWFREAGIFNEFGEPGPRSDWTWEDFRKIAKKLTDPSKIVTAGPARSATSSLIAPTESIRYSFRTPPASAPGYSTTATRCFWNRSRTRGKW